MIGRVIVPEAFLPLFVQLNAEQGQVEVGDTIKVTLNVKVTTVTPGPLPDNPPG